MNILDPHDRLKRIGKFLLQMEPVSDEDREFLGHALIEIGNGDDAYVALEIKVGKGQSNYKSALSRENRKIMAMGYVATLKAPIEKGGLGLTLEQVKDHIVDELSTPV